MTTTRAQLEAVLIKRVGVWFTSAGLDGTTIDGTNGDLNDPLASALLELGYTVTDITSVADADVSAVPATDLPRLLALAELRALETASAGIQDVSGLGYSVKTRLGDVIKDLRASVLARYGLGGGSLTGGTLTLDFAEAS